jgi:hypothetical protein
MDWTKIELSNLITGYDSNGVRFLSLFLKEYTQEFSESVNAGCNKCIAEYLTKYKLKFKVMENKSDYILKKKYEGLSLNDHSSVMVNNDNITNDYAKELLKRFSAETIFDVFPKKEKENIEFEKSVVVNPNTVIKSKTKFIKR